MPNLSEFASFEYFSLDKNVKGSVTPLNFHLLQPLGEGVTSLLCQFTLFCHNGFQDYSLSKGFSAYIVGHLC
jgi:hypothetical protein